MNIAVALETAIREAYICNVLMNQFLLQSMIPNWPQTGRQGGGDSVIRSAMSSPCPPNGTVFEASMAEQQFEITFLVRVALL